MRLEEIARAKALDSDTIEIWFADEAHVGQKNKITRRWAKRGTRPSAPRDQRTASTYIFGAVCPKQGQRQDAAAYLGVRTATLDKAVRDARVATDRDDQALPHW